MSEMLANFGYWSNDSDHVGCATGCNEEVDENVDDMEDAESGSGDHAYDDDDE